MIRDYMITSPLDTTEIDMINVAGAILFAKLYQFSDLIRKTYDMIL